MHIKTFIVLFSLLFSSFANAADNISIAKFGDITLHTFYGISNSHIIETANELRLIDAQMTFKHAKALKQYIKTLNKPLAQLILSHNHPDHWFGAEIFAKDTQIVTSANVSDDLKNGAARYIKGLKKKLKDNMPDSVIVPDALLNLGKHNWDGLDVIVEEYAKQEANHSLLIKLPKQNVIIGQDLFYNNMFLVASDRSRNKNWIKILKSFQANEAKKYNLILVGHGKNTNTTVFAQDIKYLNALEATLAKGLSKEETMQLMIKQFPKKGGEGLLKISMRNLFHKH